MGYFIPAYNRPNYVVSSDGEVVSLRRGGFKTIKQCVRPDGYLCVGLGDGNGDILSTTVHRLILESFVGPRTGDQQCRHLNGIKTDNRLENLKWGSPMENTEDRKAHKNPRKKWDSQGDKNHRAKLTTEAVIFIRGSDIEGRKLAKIFGVSRSAIYGIRNGKTWRDVKC